MKVVPSTGSGPAESAVMISVVDVTTGEKVKVPLEKAADLPLDDLGQFRRIPHHRRQTHAPGSYWSSTTGTLLNYESNLERCWLTMLDFEPDVDQIVPQPMLLEGPIGDYYIQHVPDFFVRSTGGRRILVDVTHTSRADKDRLVTQVEATRLCCDAAGWEYLQLLAPPEQRWQNIAWLSAYRRSAGIQLDLCDRLVRLASRPVRIDELTAFVDHPYLARPALFHLCWNSRIVFDLDLPLRDSTLMVATYPDNPTGPAGYADLAEFGPLSSLIRPQSTNGKADR